MGLVRRQIDDDFGVALTQKSVEICVIGARTEVLLGCFCPLFNLVTDSDQGRLVVQAVKLWKIDPLCHLAAPYHPNIYGAHGETPPLLHSPGEYTRWASHVGTQLSSQASAHGVPQDPIPDHLNAGLADMVGQLCTLEGGMVCHPKEPVGCDGAQFGSVAGRVHEKTGQ